MKCLIVEDDFAARKRAMPIRLSVSESALLLN